MSKKTKARDVQTWEKLGQKKRRNKGHLMKTPGERWGVQKRAKREKCEEKDWRGSTEKKKETSR